jgi:hypothetical protein
MGHGSFVTKETGRMTHDQGADGVGNLPKRLGLSADFRVSDRPKIDIE